MLDLQGADVCTGHGTAVAGIVGGKTFGVAKEATLHSVKVIGCEEQTDNYDLHAVSLVIKGTETAERDRSKHDPPKHRRDVMM